MVVRLRFQVENVSGGQLVKPASGTTKRDVGFSCASLVRRGTENALEDHESALATAHATADESKGIIELHEVNESEFLKSVDVLADHCPPCAGRSLEQATESQLLKSAHVLAERCPPCAGRSREQARVQKMSGAAEMTAHATAGESDGTIGFCRLSEIEFPSLNSSGCVAAVACARLPAVPGLSAAASSSAFPPAPGSSSSAVSAVVAHARSTPMHVAHNSWSDTVRGKGSHVHKEG